METGPRSGAARAGLAAPLTLVQVCKPSHDRPNDDWRLVHAPYRHDRPLSRGHSRRARRAQRTPPGGFTQRVSMSGCRACAAAVPRGTPRCVWFSTLPHPPLAAHQRRYLCGSWRGVRTPAPQPPPAGYTRAPKNSGTRVCLRVAMHRALRASRRRRRRRRVRAAVRELAAAAVEVGQRARGRERELQVAPPADGHIRQVRTHTAPLPAAAATGHTTHTHHHVRTYLDSARGGGGGGGARVGM